MKNPDGFSTGTEGGIGPYPVANTEVIDTQSTADGVAGRIKSETEGKSGGMDSRDYAPVKGRRSGGY